ncbi:uncharacterized protein LOC131686980 [Topomyia yanbarensis]|uniref:uncharacterized protein LOC131686980 n=1 Tax=Topomyia yanbarensis TaxID=2498891 RepID=UPI00273BE075|nr:uncharacterized protein LOC131686980 [Topomyia yanbarensis]
MFQLIILLASLIYVNAEIVETVPADNHYKAAPIVHYVKTPTYGYSHAAPMLPVHSHGYATPVYSTPEAARYYAPMVSNKNNGGYSWYPVQLATTTIALTQPQVHRNGYAHNSARIIATHPIPTVRGYAIPTMQSYAQNYGPVISHQHHGNNHYSTPLIATTVTVTQPQQQQLYQQSFAPESHQNHNTYGHHLH